MTDHGAMEFHRFHQTETSLISEFQKWCADQGLPQMSADELLAEDVTAEQTKYLKAFIDRWHAIVR